MVVVVVVVLRIWWRVKIASSILLAKIEVEIETIEIFRNNTFFLVKT